MTLRHIIGWKRRLTQPAPFDAVRDRFYQRWDHEHSTWLFLSLGPLPRWSLLGCRTLQRRWLISLIFCRFHPMNIDPTWDISIKLDSRQYRNEVHVARISTCRTTLEKWVDGMVIKWSSPVTMAWTMTCLTVAFCPEERRYLSLWLATWSSHTKSVQWNRPISAAACASC